jgi:hypothetical protein
MSDKTLDVRIDGTTIIKNSDGALKAVEPTTYWTVSSTFVTDPVGILRSAQFQALEITSQYSDDINLLTKIQTTDVTQSNVNLNLLIGYIDFDGAEHMNGVSMTATHPSEDVLQTAIAVTGNTFTWNGKNVATEDQIVQSDWNAASGAAEILNKPTIPAAQVNADWNATSGVAQILNKPTIPGDYWGMDDSSNFSCVSYSSLTMQSSLTSSGSLFSNIQVTSPTTGGINLNLFVGQLSVNGSAVTTTNEGIAISGTYADALQTTVAVTGNTFTWNGKNVATEDQIVQSDWNVTSDADNAYIKNKPTIPTPLWEISSGALTPIDNPKIFALNLADNVNSFTMNYDDAEALASAVLNTNHLIIGEGSSTTAVSFLQVNNSSFAASSGVVPMLVMQPSAFLAGSFPSTNQGWQIQAGNSKLVFAANLRNAPVTNTLLFAEGLYIEPRPLVFLLSRADTTMASAEDPASLLEIGFDSNTGTLPSNPGCVIGYYSGTRSGQYVYDDANLCGFKADTSANFLVRWGLNADNSEMGLMQGTPGSNFTLSNSVNAVERWALVFATASATLRVATSDNTEKSKLVMVADESEGNSLLWDNMQVVTANDSTNLRLRMSTMYGVPTLGVSTNRGSSFANVLTDYGNAEYRATAINFCAASSSTSPTAVVYPYITYQVDSGHNNYFAVFVSSSMWFGFHDDGNISKHEPPAGGGAPVTSWLVTNWTSTRPS